MRSGESINYLASGAIASYRLVKFGAADGSVAIASAATDLLIGGNGRIAAADGDRIDVVRDDFVEVQLGGTVMRGQKLTTDSSGRAIASAPTTGSNVQVIGIAESSGIINDVIWLRIAPSVMQG